MSKEMRKLMEALQQEDITSNRAQMAFDELKEIGVPVIDRSDYEGQHFIISAEDNTDEIWADYYQEFGIHSETDGVNPKIVNILNKHGLYAEWINPGMLGVSENDFIETIQNREYNETVHEDDGKYFVMAGGGISEPYTSGYANTPEEAITLFFQYQEHTPTDVNISGNVQDMEELIAWALANRERVGDIMTSTGADKIYNKEYWITQHMDNAGLNMADFHDWDDGKGPIGRAHPFTGG